MADLRLCNEVAFRIPLSFFERSGLAMDRLEVTFLPADVRGQRHQFNSRIANMCALRAHTRLRPCEMCRIRAFSTGPTRHGSTESMRDSTVDARSTQDVPCTGTGDSAEKPEITACSLVTSLPEEGNTPIQLRDDQLVQTACQQRVETMRGVQETFVLCLSHQICRIHEIPHNQREFRHKQRAVCFAQGKISQQTNQR